MASRKGTRKRAPASTAGSFQIHGLAETAPGTLCLPLTALHSHARVIAEFRPGASRAAASERTVTVGNGDLIEIELNDGQRLWMSGLDYRERQKRANSRDLPGNVIPATTHLQVLPRAMQTRGPVAWAVKSLKIVGLDLAKVSAAGLAKLLDGRTAADKRPGLGLYRCRLETGRFELAPAARATTSSRQPHLLLIHGTASSTWGSFGDLWSTERSAELGALRDKYTGGVFGFEHGSLMADPVANTLELLRLLPKGARIDLLSYARGGLIGELLCRARNIRGEPFGLKEIEIYRNALEARAEEMAEAGATGGGIDVVQRVGQLRELNRRLAEVQPVVERFVRVACPALGTTLASRRLDRWLSVVGNVASVALPATPLADWFSDIADFMAAVISTRTDPATLPGLEAMMPDSALIRMLNWPMAEVEGDLAVIAGDIDPDAWWARLLVWATDRFYRGDHDLVVNTSSMSGGARRSGKALVSTHKGGSVNHFNYFSNKASAEDIVQALLHEPGPDEGFKPITPPAQIARAVEARATTPRPVVFVIPGIMGSELHVGRDRVWLDVPGLIFGGFKKLSIDAKGVTAFRPIPAYYGDLINFLGQSHHVIPFPFDWRLPIEVEADRLAERVKAELEIASRFDMPVRLLAHSMGGLVSRTMIARHPQLWARVSKHVGARLIMLGTPNGGSHAVTELLVGKASVLKGLALVDFSQRKLDLLKVIARFPGVLAMLPKDPKEDYFSPQTWVGYSRLAGKGWIVPDADSLARARRFRDFIDGAPLQPQATVYVAGNADVTLAAMEFDHKRKAIRFFGTVRGDGRVTWDSGIPPGVPTWYMDVEHGDLCDVPHTFPAIRELLDTGTTNLLSQTPKVARGAVDLFPVEPEEMELYPTEEVLAAAMIGAGHRKHKARARAAVPVEVRVSHGDLAYAKYPVAVGHYAGDAIVSAEKYLDSVLGGELSRRHLLGLYPGPIGSSAIFINRQEQVRQIQHPGALVIGLGTPGQLSAGALSRTFMHALLEYVVEADRDPDAAGALKTIGVSTLLIGSGAGGVNVSDCVYALITGAGMANEALEQARQSRRIGPLHLIELWEDRAIQAVEALQELARRQDLQGTFNPALVLHRSDGGLRRLRYEEPTDWWHRLQILGGGKDGEPDDGTLRFSASTRRARSEVRLQRTQRSLVDIFIERAVGQTTDNQAVAGTLFELLLPNELKDQAPDRGNLVLLVDEAAARYPWELLRDPARPDSVPPAIEQGLLRQLESYEFRESVRPVIQNTALVIGDPESEFPELPGARAEAEAVWQALRSRGNFHVEKRIRPNAQEVMIALHAKAYRVLHLAGHGVYRFPRKQEGPVTGMVLGDNIFLSPDEVRKMRQVPEIVFINCCHLGRIESAARSDYNRMAANLSTEFIQMGVRAVVAAGWAVDDDAAAVFAQTLYERLLSGVAFGKAVHQARRETYQQFPQSNTWGAYQCYGDPHWKLVRDAGDVPGEQETPLFVTPAQAAVDLQNLAAQLKTGALTPESGRLKLKALAARLEKANLLDDPLVLAPLGRAYGEAELFPDSVRLLRAALIRENASVSISDVEMLANQEARDALRIARESKPSPEDAEHLAITEIDTAIRRLQALTSVAGAQDAVPPRQDGSTPMTVERLALLGSAYKRKAWITSAARQRATALEQSCGFYRQAYARRKDCYPFLNLLASEIVLSWNKRTGVSPELARLLKQELPATRASLQESFARDRGFWNSVMAADLDLLEAIAGKNPSAESMERIVAGYRAAAERGSPREFASVIEQLDFLAAMAMKPVPHLHRWLQETRDRVKGTPAATKPAAKKRPRRPRRRR